VSSYVSVKLRRRIRELFNDRCAYCQNAEALTGDIFEIEHIIPRSANGETVFESVPALIQSAGAAACFAWEEFFHGRIWNPFTRKAYLHSVRLFFKWMEQHGLDLVRVTPGHVGQTRSSIDAFDRYGE